MEKGDKIIMASAGSTLGRKEAQRTVLTNTYGSPEAIGTIVSGNRGCSIGTMIA